MNGSPADLGELEGAIMQLVWSHGPLTAEIARQQLNRPLKESTIRTVLRRLEEKGWVSHAVEGRTFVYRAAEPRATVAAKAVKRVVDWFCNGAADEVLVGMVDGAMLDDAQLKRLQQKIAEARKAKPVRT
jgi:BlaI family transcriptional regulator, penicillinase repressor